MFGVPRPRAMGLKAYWQVTAGVIPERIEGEHTKVWYYTSEDYEKDCLLSADSTETSIFQQMALEAQAYWLSRNDPRYLNWADLKFMWM